jgi:hypothetical protein
MTNILNERVFVLHEHDGIFVSDSKLQTRQQSTIQATIYLYRDHNKFELHLNHIELGAHPIKRHVESSSDLEQQH